MSEPDPIPLSMPDVRERVLGRLGPATMGRCAPRGGGGGCPIRHRPRQRKPLVYADPSIEEILASDLLGDYPAVQYVPPAGAFHLDILTRLGEAFEFADLETQRIAFDGLDVHVVTPRMLYRMKRDTVRAKDRADAEALRQRFDLEDEP